MVRDLTAADSRFSLRDLDRPASQGGGRCVRLEIGSEAEFQLHAVG